MSDIHEFDTPRQIGAAGLVTTALITLAITAILTVLSISFGGFGSYAAEGSDGRGLSPPIIVHLATAIPALLLGPFILLRRKGDRIHRLMGKTWVLLMLVTAIASAFIRSPGAGIMGTGYSFIHFFTVWTLTMAPLGVWMARQGKVAAHQGIMTGLYVGLVIAGATTLLPGRMFGTMLFL